MQIVSARLTAVTLLLVLLTADASFGAGRERALAGTYLQLVKAHGTWSQKDWAELFSGLRRLELGELVVQWTVHADDAFYPSSVYKPVASPPLEHILSQADRLGMKVLVGLTDDGTFWQAIDREPDRVEAYLRRSRLRSGAAARELAPLVRRHTSFEGWYVTEEIDDVHWLPPERRRLLAQHLSELSRFLHALTPGVKVAVSGFSNAHADPGVLEAFWRDVLHAAPLDRVLFQDGIGVEKLELTYLELYLAAMRNAVRAEGRELRVVVETFRQVDGPPMNDRPFRAMPAPVERVEKQLELAARYSPGGAIAFSVPDYMVPRAGADAKRLFEGYLALLEGGYLRR